MADSDWEAFLSEIGVTQEQMDEAARLMPAPKKEPEALYFLSKSDIAGTGVFAKQDINGYVGKLWKADDWYVAGRYINHTASPNTIPIRFKDEIIAYGEVKKGEEITLNYRDMRKLIEHSE